MLTISRFLTFSRGSLLAKALERYLLAGNVIFKSGMPSLISIH
jgi:hypothetical protein